MGMIRSISGIPIMVAALQGALPVPSFEPKHTG